MAIIRLPRYRHLYVLAAPLDYPWIGKIGVADEEDDRTPCIRKSVCAVMQRTVEVECYMKLPVLFAYKYEQWLHRKLDRFNLQKDTFRGSSGWTEWYRCINVGVFALSWAGLGWMGVPEAFYKALFIFLVPIPLDFMLYVLVIFLIEWTIMLSAVGGLAYFTYSVCF